MKNEADLPTACMEKSGIVPEGRLMGNKLAPEAG